MYSDWEHAHTNFTEPAPRRAPASLTDSESDWRRHLETSTPNGRLLCDNAMTDALRSGRPIHLLHTTRNIDAIRTSGQLHVSTGCLVGALYCTPLTDSPRGLRPHNLGAYLLRTKPTHTPIVLEVAPGAPVPPKGIDYLHLGPIHLRIYQRYRTFLTQAEADQVERTVLAGLRAAAPFLDLALRNAVGRSTAAPAFLDRLASAVPAVPFLGYLYFEVLSEYLTLHSTTPETAAFAARGELNSHLGKRLAHRAVDGMDRLFDLSLFSPRHDRLLQLVGGIEPALAPAAAEYVRRRLSHLLARTALHPSQDAAAVTFHQADLQTLRAAAPGLLGQMLFREVRYLPRYPQLYHLFEKAKAIEAWGYWNSEGIPTPLNGVLPKGEIGINPAHPGSVVRAWTADLDCRGHLHRAEELAAAPAPHLASWWAPPRQREPHPVVRSAPHPAAHSLFSGQRTLTTGAPA
ncbi:hypothetical protein [Kitasatospora griseola]|uniref:hypothetical protein n=1 Tax=Kitasatospora griseola TaxID=2064 RepID=UPI003435299A